MPKLAVIFVLLPGVSLASGKGEHADSTQVRQSPARVPALHGPRVIQRLSGLRRKAAAPIGPVAPRTPKGLQRCTEILAPASDLPRDVGETIRYVVDVNGIGVGTVDFKIQRKGAFAGQSVTEYRTLFNLDSLVSILLSAKGRAASLVPLTAGVPVRSMSRLTNSKGEFDEDTLFAGDSSRVESSRKKNGKTKQQKRVFPYPVRDFVSGFYLLRSLPPDANGCAVVYANHRAYTVWITPDGEEDVKTPVGMQPARRYRLRYGSERSKRVLEGTIWLAKDETRLPFKAALKGKSGRLEARIHTFEMGR